MSVLLIVKKEIRTFIYTPTIYVCLALFVFLVNYLTFVVGNFFDSNEASLAGSFFRWHPWLYAFFAPAICMRLWSEEYRQKTLELLITMGFHSWQLVIGKFIAAWCVLLAALALTLPIVVLLYLLGPPDAGAIVAAYIGSAFLSGTLLAVSLAASCISNNQFVSYIAGASMCAMLLILGSADSMNVFIRMFADATTLTAWVSGISMTSHFIHFQQGTVPLGSLIYFISLSAMTLYFAQGLICSNQTMKASRFDILPSWLLILACFVLVNVLATRFPYVWDLTEARKHSLSSVTKNTLKDLKYPVTIRYYISESENAMPYQLRVHADKVDYFLRSIERIGSGNIKIVTVDPTINSEDEKNAQFDGIDSRQGDVNSRFYFGLSLQSLDKKTAIPFLHPEREALLEYDVLRAIQRIIHREQKTIGLISSLPIEGGKYANDSGQGRFPEWLFVKELRKSHKLVFYHNDADTLLDSPPDLLILINPVGMPEKSERNIDQYLAYGGNLILMLDPYSAALDMISPNENKTRPPANFKRLLETWGLKYRPDEVVADILSSSQINRGHGAESSMIALSIAQRYIHKTDSVTAGIHALGFPFSGHFWPSHMDSNVQMIPLVSSSEQSSTVNPNQLINLTKEKNDELSKNFKPDGQRRVMVVKLSGDIPSAFPETKRERTEASSKQARIILFADADFIFDAFAGESIALSQSTSSVRSFNGNLALFSNAVDALIGEKSLGALRSKGANRYPLARLMELSARIDASYIDQRQALQAERHKLENRLNALTHTEYNSHVLRYEIQKKQQQQIIDQLNYTEQKLDGIAQLVEQGIQKRKNQYQWTVTLAIPVIIFLFSIFIILRRDYTTRAI